MALKKNLFFQGKMLDLIFVVDDAAEWHRENIARNSHHYSFLQYYGVDTIANVQRAAAGVYYNTLIEINGQVCLRFIMLIGCCTITVVYLLWEVELHLPKGLGVHLAVVITRDFPSRCNPPETVHSTVLHTYSDQES